MGDKSPKQKNKNAQQKDKVDTTKKNTKAAADAAKSAPKPGKK